MRSVGLIPNIQKDQVAEITSRMYKILSEHDIDVYLTHEGADLIGTESAGVSSDVMGEVAEMIIILGGDGTILKAAREYAPYDIPLLGINLGKMGFLAEIEANEVMAYLESLLTGNYTIEERMMLDATVLRDRKEITTFSALNDVIIAKGPFSRIIEVETKVGGNYLETYPGDGLIVTSPTGSTGYSFSAGGPIISSNLEVMMITPICPHLMHNRSVIISSDEVVTAKMKTNYAVVVLTVDGQQGFTLQDGDEIKVKKSNYKTKLVKLRRRSFYQLLNEKLTGGQEV
ncbi:NAD(+)/NADH kinase [Natranaerobius thermophilus]|uniref:NAD kinase n=1 Tax=Natranaerobius thermophilus (strain ATCC BAA-1301 / DSM 18059 / JW/NM-WN-LF) TaxID=457570 RepID=NADK_NATTJ|nr:NAD(+)/NADH kinase [Natranaerobius thermophilus]B2A524.1 RecName: Full=NAD kinase; AltName: Full=ATP-dependent NAD kinase [Natranaerobius thermophilus JW/NM-WN-LF]ACB85266.1 ATP-NAD/AcoX kinase [Natranaerobius thermophilus JW/NM-WN-LF]